MIFLNYTTLACFIDKERRTMYVASKMFLTKGVGQNREDRIVKTRNITQTIVGKSGVWTTVVAAAVLIPRL